MNSSAVMPGKPASIAVGMSGAPFSRSFAVTARMRTLPALCSASTWPVMLMVDIGIAPET